MCPTELSGRQRRFCSDRCKEDERFQHVESLTCPQCNRSWERKSSRGRVSRQPKSLICRSCVSSNINKGRTGDRNPAWKGGDTVQEGRFGRDPQGLSWKQQQRFAWERDNYACQWEGCAKKGSPNGWHPHVHHKVRYRISRSHALENLICHCASHHKKAEALAA